MPAAAAGFLTSLSLIVAIGAQNAFVLRQGLRREHVLPVVVVCALADAVLIGAGIAGLGAVVAAHPVALETIRYGGAAFLLAYGALAARRAFRPGAAGLTAEPGPALPASAPASAPAPPSASAAAARATTGLAPATTATMGTSTTTGTTAPAPAGTALRTVLLTCLGFTFLNPHVYLDTVVLLGALASRYGDGRWLYGVGAVLASAVWFVALGFGAGRLSRFFERPRSWRILDAVIAGIMMMLAAGLLISG
jgi:L-lysine exporter family protein LysE/ArgO